MPNYNAIAAKVKAGFTKAGIAMTLRKTTAGAFDSATGTYTGGYTTDYATVGLFQAPQSTSGTIGQRFFNGIEVQTDDELILLAVIDGAVPAAGDLLIVGGVTYNITTLLLVRPGGTALMYRVLARK